MSMINEFLLNPRECLVAHARGTRAGDYAARGMQVRASTCWLATSGPAWPVPVVETIGAGDAFAGVLASELARGRQLDEAPPLDTAAGALAVTRPGAHEGLPTGAQVRAFLMEQQRAEGNGGVGLASGVDRDDC
jgi:sugar/nucleoside kinase (ribokinase family)